MKDIEIITAHNVVIQYEIASLPNRIAAFFIDSIILFFYLIFANLLLAAFTIGSINLFEDTNGIAALIYIVMLLPVFFYSFFMETFFAGQSVGKMALGIRVVNIKGASPSIGDLFLRWTFRMVEILMSGGGIAIVAILVNEKKQRLGGLVSNTLVIQLKSSKSYSIKNILTLKNKDNYEPTYPNVIQFTDEDVLFIKNALERQKKFKNTSHNQVLLELSKMSAEKLQLTDEPKNKLKFLNTLVKDYVVLTRS